MNEYDCLLLEHAFGNRPDDCHKVRDYVLETIASDPGLQQTELVFLGLFGRACRLLAEEPGSPEMADARSEAGTLVELLESRHAAITYSLDGAFPELRDTTWQSEASVQSAVQVRARERAEITALDRGRLAILTVCYQILLCAISLKRNDVLRWNYCC